MKSQGQSQRTKEIWEKYCEYRHFNKPEHKRYYRLYLISKRLDAKRNIAFLEDFRERYLAKGFDSEMVKSMVGELDCQIDYFADIVKETTTSINDAGRVS